MLDPINQLVRIRKEQARLKVQYDQFLAEALQQGYSNAMIARKLGLTDTAIRLYRKRHNIEAEQPDISA